MPDNPLELIPLEVATQRDALAAGEVDAALVRLPIDQGGLHVIRLYDETPVVVCAADSHLTAADELTVADLAGEVVFAPDLTADAVTEAARGLLASESARVGARKVADEIASMPLPAETVKRLAEFAG